MPSEYRKPIDDRGRVLTTVFVEDTEELVGDLHLPKEVVERVRRSVGAHSVFSRSIPPKSILIWIAMIVAAGLANALLVASGWTWWGWPETGRIMVFVVVGGCVAFVLGQLPARPHHGMLRAIVGEGYCGGCGYHLRRVPTEPDGCTVCPECGAAWKLPPPASANEPSTPT